LSARLLRRLVSQLSQSVALHLETFRRLRRFLMCCGLMPERQKAESEVLKGLKRAKIAGPR